ncbi:cyclin-dependent kinase inhibitor 1B-like [Salvelinus namaycush]|uniref:Cyclin-dependent kinase inhibitor 1B-like n=1 Tax=Salvelinus namaycush TaxID=8040 RepID=A0A8U1BQN2_SALNM|nr:cyclin-dependent kinase inhibitor 1B-like [Salvelinus namaycush]XP_038857573.1 cyclin-dependent kinase inhibitor 1B-like [Salvelinus namaycush]
MRTVLRNSIETRGQTQPQLFKDTLNPAIYLHLLLNLGETMSNVLLLSSAMERLSTPMTFPLHARTGVCRNLFGPVDHDELNRDMKSKMREISYRDQRKWNFNFEAEVPLSGDYVWEETPVDMSPVFYQDSVQVGRARIVVTPVNVKPDVDVILLDSSSQGESPHYDDRLTSSKGNTPCLTEVNQENCAVKLNSGKPTRKQVPCVRCKITTDTTTLATDFYMKRKRMTTETKLNESTCHHPSSQRHVEQTQRKKIR